MRSSIIIFSVLLCMCSAPQQAKEFMVIGGSVPEMVPIHLDLNFPVYLVPESSFFVGCNQKDCRQRRIALVKNAIADWQSKLPANVSVNISVVEQAPVSSYNPAITLGVELDGCKDAYVPPGLVLWACYNKYGRIVFLDAAHITVAVAAHEIGHAFGLGHELVMRTENCQPPIMSEPISSDKVTSLDVRMLCYMHPELKCPINIGSVYEGFYRAIECDWMQNQMPFALRIVVVRRK